MTFLETVGTVLLTCLFNAMLFGLASYASHWHSRRHAPQTQAARIGPTGTGPLPCLHCPACYAPCALVHEEPNREIRCMVGGLLCESCTDHTHGLCECDADLSIHDTDPGDDEATH